MAERVTKKQALMAAASYAELTGRRMCRSYKDIGALAVDQNIGGMELVEITSKTGTERLIFNTGHNSPRQFRDEIFMAKQGIMDYKESPAFIEDAMCRVYRDAWGTPELRQAVLELVKNNIAQRCERYRDGEKEFETFGYGFMSLLKKDESAAVALPNGFTIKIGEAWLFTFSQSKNQDDDTIYQARLEVSSNSKLSTAWLIE